MNARNREEEYLRRMKALGYESSLNGMDDDDIEWELSKMEEADRRREAEWQQPLRTVYRPVDPGLKARILRMFGQPYDESAIPKGQESYLNGWDNGEDENEVRTLVSQREQRKTDFNAPDFDPWKNAWKLDWGEDGNPLAGPQKMEHWPRRDGAMFPSRGDAFRPLSYTAGGNDVNTGGRGTNTSAANTNASGYADGGAEGDMTLPDAAAQNQGQGTNAAPNLLPQIAGGEHLGYLSVKHEAGGDSGKVPGGQGDPGGKSYGAFQFSSKNNVPTEFVTWLAANNPDVYARLQRARDADGNDCGPTFDAEWEKIAQENPDAFLDLQYAFTKQKYYDPAVAAIQKETGFDFNDKSFALKNVL